MRTSCSPAPGRTVADKVRAGRGKVLDDGDVAALFGLEMAEGEAAGLPAAAVPKPSRRAKAKTAKAPATTKAVRPRAATETDIEQ